MARLVVFGATGYTGGNILDEAVRRGHEVVAVARHVDTVEPRPGVHPVAGSIHDAGLVREVASGADALISAVHATPSDGHKLLDTVPLLLETAAAAGARLGVVGGAASLLVAEGGPRLLDAPDFHPQWKQEATNQAEVLAALRTTDTTTDWFYISPPQIYGAFTRGERTGSYRLGGDVLLRDADGRSTIGGADFALAVVDEIDNPAHHRQRFTVAY
jgi:putative NADH-flavin reductase